MYVLQCMCSPARRPCVMPCVCVFCGAQFVSICLNRSGQYLRVELSVVANDSPEVALTFWSTFCILHFAVVGTRRQVRSDGLNSPQKSRDQLPLLLPFHCRRKFFFFARTRQIYVIAGIGIGPSDTMADPPQYICLSKKDPDLSHFVTNCNSHQVQVYLISLFRLWPVEDFDCLVSAEESPVYSRSHAV